MIDTLIAALYWMPKHHPATDKLSALIEQIEKAEPVACADHGVLNWLDGHYFEDMADLSRIPPQPAPVPEGCINVAERIHYPQCWDTAAYPTLEAALIECRLECSEHPLSAALTAPTFIYQPTDPVVKFGRDALIPSPAAPGTEKE